MHPDLPIVVAFENRQVPFMSGLNGTHPVAYPQCVREVRDRKLQDLFRLQFLVLSQQRHQRKGRGASRPVDVIAGTQRQPHSGIEWST